jgi:hypothetical protein
MSFWGEICVHTSFFIIFLTTFYFTFVTYIQSEGLVNDFFKMINPQLITTAAFKSPSQVEALGTAVGNTMEKAAQAMPPVDANNKTIAMYVGIVVGIVSAGLLALGIYLQYISGGSITELLISNLIVLGFIAISEFIIVGLFLRNFVEINQQFVAGMVAVQFDSRLSGNHNCKFVADFLQTILPDFISNKF